MSKKRHDRYSAICVELFPDKKQSAALVKTIITTKKLRALVAKNSGWIQASDNETAREIIEGVAGLDGLMPLLHRNIITGEVYNYRSRNFKDLSKEYEATDNSFSFWGMFQVSEPKNADFLAVHIATVPGLIKTDMAFNKKWQKLCGPMYFVGGKVYERNGRFFLLAFYYQRADGSVARNAQQQKMFETLKKIKEANKEKCERLKTFTCLDNGTNSGRSFSGKMQPSTAGNSPMKKQGEQSSIRLMQSSTTLFT